jgi:hypothetical protein
MKLSKREIVLLSILIIIALVFIEFSLVINPNRIRLADMASQNDSLENEINTINLNLTIAKSMEKRRDENLTMINELAKPFLNRVTPDSLLVFTHEMLVKHGFSPFNYTPLPLEAVVLQPEQAAVSQLTYRIKEVADEYRNLGKPATNGTTNETSGTNPTTPLLDNDAVEIFTLNINANGTYDQIKAMLDDFASLARTIIISNIAIIPDPVNIGMLKIDFQINYYGIEKLEASDDPINAWTRETIPVSTADPFVPGTAPSETVATTAAP